MKTQTEQFLRKRKFLLVMPLLVIPFITLGFWALGGGSGKQVSGLQPDSSGFNPVLPEAQFKEEKSRDKLSYYEQAGRDSQQINEIAPQQPLPDTTGTATGNTGLATFSDPNEEKINRKLAQINQEINREPEPVDAPANYQNTLTDPSANDITRLESLMNSMSQGNAEDPEMQQLNAMMEKILDIQHPERVRDKIREQSLKNKAGAYPVHAPAKEKLVDLMQSASRDTTARSFPVLRTGQTGFLGLGNEMDSAFQNGNAIQAVIRETQTLVSGAVVKMTLLNDIYVNGILIPKGQQVNGVCTLNDERLIIDIETVRYRNNILPVALAAYDMDGLEGLYIPGAITRDAAKQGADDAIQSIRMMNVDPSITAQAASAGIEAAKGLFSRKAKLIKVTIKSGYQILLRDNHTNN